jgi:3-hydroxyacyl-[acyl-carrier-protein] dehydratase
VVSAVVELQIDGYIGRFGSTSVDIWVSQKHREDNPCRAKISGPPCRPALTYLHTPISHLPMRFALIDRIIEIEPDVKITAVKTLTLAEEYLADHFPNFPVMPGVLMIEAMTQAGAWLVRASENFQHSIVILKEAANVKYGQFFEPGQTMTIRAEIIKRDEHETKIKASGSVDGRLIVGARLTLKQYNLADNSPIHRETDEQIIREMRAQYALLTFSLQKQAAEMNT